MFTFLDLFAGVSGRVAGFGARGWIFAGKLLHQGYRCHKLQKVFSKFYRRHCGLVSGFGVGMRSLLQQGLSEAEFCGGLVCRFGGNVGGTDFSGRFRKVIMRYKRVGYGINVMR